MSGGTTRIRTGDTGVADLRLTTWPLCHNAPAPCFTSFLERRTRQLGGLSYRHSTHNMTGPSGQARTGDLQIFSLPLY